MVGDEPRAYKMEEGWAINWQRSVYVYLLKTNLTPNE
jgi:hypothetical protein